MIIKKKFGFLFLILSLFFLFGLASFNLTGNAIQHYPWENFSFFHFIGMVLFFLSIFLLMTRKSLDAIIIPTGGEGSEREKKALEEYEKREIGYFIISGKLEGGESLKESQRADIYRELRRHGIKPRDIKVEGKSSDTLENAIYSLGGLDGGEKIGIVSYPRHLDRFERIIEQMKEEERIPKDIRIEYIPTDQTFKQWAYGVAANVKERFRLKRGISEGREHKTGRLGNFVKKVISGH